MEHASRRAEPPVAPRSAAPSVLTRVVAFASILVAGACGGLIGWAFADLQCEGDCTTATGLSGVAGAAFGAGGVAIVAVLVLRAMGEWQAGGRRLDRGDRPDAPPPTRPTC